MRLFFAFLILPLHTVLSNRKTNLYVFSSICSTLIPWFTTVEYSSGPAQMTLLSHYHRVFCPSLGRASLSNLDSRWWSPLSCFPPNPWALKVGPWSFLNCIYQPWQHLARPVTEGTRGGSAEWEQEGGASTPAEEHRSSCWARESRSPGCQRLLPKLSPHEGISDHWTPNNQLTFCIKSFWLLT